MRLTNKNIAWLPHIVLWAGINCSIINPIKPYITQEKVYKVSNYTVVDTSFQMYNNYAEDKFGGGVISIFVFPLATTTEVLALTAIGSM